MHNVYLTLLLVGINLITFAQERRDYEHYSYAERQSKYPFNKAKSAKLVSFGIAIRHQDERGEPRMPALNGLPDLSKMDEVVDIPRSDLDSIADILLNTCHRLDSFESVYVLCYSPRNAVLFYDSAAKNFASLEICFECQKIKPSSPKIYFDSLTCDNIYADLQKFFKRRGLKTSAVELSKELRELEKRDEKDSANYLPVDEKKMKEATREVIGRMKKMEKYKGIPSADISFLYPAKFYKYSEMIELTVKVKGIAILKMHLSPPEYLVPYNITHLR